jgi:ubiquinone/menaquinone biosynthesis C-methylase UbiE
MDRPMERLASTSELMDGPLDDRVALATNLRDLRRVNRLLGGTDLSRRALAALAGQDRGPMTILDVGTGGADIPAALIADAAQQGVSLEVTAMDSRPEMLQTALATEPRLATIPSLRLRVGDGRRLADQDRSYDIAHSSMVIHHLEPDEAVVFLREMGRVAEDGVIVNDLVRSRLNWVGAWLISHLFTRSRYTRYDAPLSVRRAYTLAELESLLARAGLRPVATIRGMFGHRYAIAAIAEPEP